MTDIETDIPNPDQDQIAVEIPDDVWAKLADVWPAMHKATLHWRRGNKRFSAAASTWAREGKATPMDMMSFFFRERVVPQEKIMGEDLEWMVRVFDAEGDELERVKWAFLMNPVDEAQIELLGVVHGLVRVAKVQQGMLIESYKGRAEDQRAMADIFDKVQGAVDKSLEMQTAVVDAFADIEGEKAQFEFRQEAVKDLFGFLNSNADLLHDILGIRKTADPSTLAEIPPDLRPFAASVLSSDRDTVEAYLDTLSETDADFMRSRLSETEAGREVLKSLAELMGGA